jgi:peptide deformylase
MISSWQDKIQLPLSVLFGSETTEEKDPGKVGDLYIRKYPHPCLRAENSEVTKEEIETGQISKLTKEMFTLMYATDGCGLAAPQVGINKRIMVYNVSGDPKRWLDEIVMINPKIVEYSDGKDIEIEGCLSFPKLRGEVERSKWIKVEALTLKGKPIKKKFVGWDARVFQHEYDHLDGVVFPDRMTEQSKVAAKNQLDQWIAEYGEGGAI